MITDRNAVFEALKARELDEVTRMVGHHFGRLHGVSIEEKRLYSDIATREVKATTEQIAAYGKLTDPPKASLKVTTGFT